MHRLEKEDGDLNPMGSKGIGESGIGGLLRFEVDANSLRGAIWGSGSGPAIDAAGQIWAETGNGSGSSYDLQESVVKLDSSLSLQDSWARTPCPRAVDRPDLTGRDRAGSRCPA